MELETDKFFVCRQGGNGKLINKSKTEPLSWKTVLNYGISQVNMSSGIWEKQDIPKSWTPELWFLVFSHPVKYTTSPHLVGPFLRSDRSKNMSRYEKHQH